LRNNSDIRTELSTDDYGTAVETSLQSKCTPALNYMKK